MNEYQRILTAVDTSQSMGGVVRDMLRVYANGEITETELHELNILMLSKSRETVLFNA